MAFDVEGPFCFGDSVLAFPSEPRVEAGVLATAFFVLTSEVELLQESFVKDSGPPPPKGSGLWSLDSSWVKKDSWFAVVGAVSKVSVLASSPSPPRKSQNPCPGWWWWLFGAGEGVPGSKQENLMSL